VLGGGWVNLRAGKEVRFLTEEWGKSLEKCEGQCDVFQSNVCKNVPAFRNLTLTTRRQVGNRGKFTGERSV